MREVRRVAREELEGTLKELLTVNDQARSTAVHEARKHLKKVRALIRLLRPATCKAFYKRENAAMRNTAQRMSSIPRLACKGADDNRHAQGASLFHTSRLPPRPTQSNRRLFPGL